jgi:hypothetical protein
LIVGIGVDNDISALFDATVQSGQKGPRQALVAGKADDVVRAVILGNLSSSIPAAVVDDQPLHTVKPRNFTGQVFQGKGQSLSLIETWYLDNEFHIFSQERLFFLHLPVLRR